MKNKLIILMLFTIFLSSSCEKIIDVKLDTEQPRLVVDAALSWVKGTNGKNQSITLSTTTGYFDQDIPKISGAIVYVKNTNNVKFDFVEEPSVKGKYSCNSFLPVIGEVYNLTIIYNGETYTGQEKLIAVNPIENVELRSDLGINRDEYGIKVNFQDFVNQLDFYVISYKTPAIKLTNFEVFSDQFFDGKKAFGLFGSDLLKLSDTIEIRLNGSSERYFSYMRKLTSTANTGGGGPFQPLPSSTIRGNIINQTNKSNFCLGYFSISETDHLNYIIK